MKYVLYQAVGECEEGQEFTVMPHYPNGERTGIYFTAKTQEAALAAARDFVERIARVPKPEPVVTRRDPPREIAMQVKATGHAGIGKVWVIHHEARDKRPVPLAELESYLARGYVRGGPRSQFAD